LKTDTSTPALDKSTVKYGETHENRKSVYLSALKEQPEEKKKPVIAAKSHAHKSSYLAALNEPPTKEAVKTTNTIEQTPATDTNHINMSSVKDYWLKQKIETKPVVSNPSPKSNFRMDITKTPLAVASTSGAHNVAATTTGTYTYEELKKKPTNLFRDKLQEYLADDEFKKVFNMSREEFNKLPVWAQSGRKKEVDLF